MRCGSFTALIAVSNALLSVSAGPLDKRQDATTTTTATSSARVIPSTGLFESVLSNGETTTIEAFNPQATEAESSGSATGSGGASITATPTATSTTTATFSKTGEPVGPSTAFPVCSNKESANPFCLPSNGSTLYYDKTYFATWDPDRFAVNSTVIVQVRLANDSTQQIWASEATLKTLGFAAVETKEYWLQGYSMYNFTLHMVVNEPAASNKAAETFNGPEFILTNEPPNHYKAPPFSKVPNKGGLLIGLPVTLGFLVIAMVGLYFGMRKQRSIGIGNIMGRRKGYGVGKSKRQRMGLGKKGGGAIRLEDRNEYSQVQYQPPSGHSRGDSLGSLVSDDGIRPNQFRSEIDRQRTGR
ncbi:hypothetical protein K504DRAFT_474459 [Pleomassaria siparia CBS 279.74]|uniref:Mid2 domain-containing protein n=1 Tax=Pleomassaria siparia CBS 279.74 TaxID=1314801 RepID=A0A6G1KGF7_9PLEO|nr:hypothetical protein K504DRAFT_474459 [Pleomassaria siparia CBS 279.74]